MPTTVLFPDIPDEGGSGSSFKDVYSASLLLPSSSGFFSRVSTPNIANEAYSSSLDRNLSFKYIAQFNPAYSISSKSVYLASQRYTPSYYADWYEHVLNDTPTPTVHIKFNNTGLTLVDEVGSYTFTATDDFAYNPTGMYTDTVGQRSIAYGGTARAYSNQSLTFPTNNYTLEVIASSTNINAGICGFQSSPGTSPSSSSRGLYFDNNGALVFHYWPGSHRYITLPNANDGLKHHIVATQNNTGIAALYVDGNLINTLDYGNDASYAGYIMLGFCKASSAVNRGGTTIDEYVAYFNRSFNQVEVQRRYDLLTGA